MTRPRGGAGSGGGAASGGDRTGPGFEMDAPLFVISVAAQLAGMHAQTLRSYDREGLVSPGRTAGGGRRYSHRDIELLREVQRLSQDDGVNRAGIRRIIELESQVDALRSRIARAAPSRSPNCRTICWGPGWTPPMPLPTRSPGCAATWCPGSSRAPRSSPGAGRAGDPQPAVTRIARPLASRRALGGGTGSRCVGAVGARQALAEEKSRFVVEFAGPAPSGWSDRSRSA